MEEKPAKLRPTKKQKELLSFIEDFIETRGYSPSYREIMKGLNYTSVATVALHVNNLIKRGHLAKRNHSARSLEVLAPSAKPVQPVVPKQLKAYEEKWLVDKTEIFFKEAEEAIKLSERELDELYILTGTLRVLGLEGASQAFATRLANLRKRFAKNQYNA